MGERDRQQSLLLIHFLPEEKKIKTTSTFSSSNSTKKCCQDECRRRKLDARQPQTLPQRLCRQTSDRQAEVGHGVQGCPGGSGQLHEHAVGPSRGVCRRKLRR